jgi:hypothetical protein
MIHRYLSAALALAAGGLLLAGCSGSTEVSLTGNTPAQFSHVWVTVSGVKFNTSATAGPDDSGWTEFDFSTPTTIDLVAANSSNLSALSDSLKVIPGTYSQIRLLPVDAYSPLSTSAQNAGAIYNFEADYVNSAGVTVQLPLEVLNPDKGIGIPTGLKVPIGSVTSALANAGVGNTSTGVGSTETGLGTSTTAGTDLSTGTTTGTTGVGVGVGSTGTTSSTSTGPANQFAVYMNGTTDLVPFTYSSQAGILLSQHASAYDLSKSGGISGTLTLTNITTGTSGLPAIGVSAEVLSADGSRYVVVSSTTVQADGTFTLFPLDASTNGTYYDVVIHGPGIATIIIKSVVVTLPDTSNTLLSNSSSTLGSSTSTTGTTSTTNTTDTTDTSTTGTTGTTGTTITTGGITANNVVQIGTLTPRSATSYTANLAATQARLPAGASVGFYQTLGGKNTKPYVIEQAAIDPFNEVLYTPQALSMGTIDSGTWASSGAAISLVSAAPIQGAANYSVAAFAPSYGSSGFTTLTGPTSSSSTTTPSPALTFTVPALNFASGTSSGTLTASVMQATAGKYDQGELLVSNNGTLVAETSLASAFAQPDGGTVTLNVPAGNSSSLYYVSVRAWNSSNPAPKPDGSLQRQWYDTPVDMRSSTGGSIKLTVN